MKLTVAIASDNAAFDDGTGGADELARILRKLADDLENDPSAGTSRLYDLNGNLVGAATFKPGDN